ncbi:hypothetical protein BDV38DRAFT_248207 [Aspergillus pseudotamarii]|uniref:Uncharacterized protein n=1 Tax=Aspergillus pseudotamarii TaxID=132259 RepID=A0A5N6STK2_ASPPS|nr:uncharacterized protein BDV38DRAFT_248207 [Aspergillus pseudotamarii]KAE8137080.1 hypothetical protein BDV38DRAFT_248207 [Aspergillus pseudotamarii]
MTDGENELFEERRVSGEEGIRGPILSGGTPSLMMTLFFLFPSTPLAGDARGGLELGKGEKGKKGKEQEKRGSEGRKKDGQAHGEIRRRKWRVGREKKRRLWVCLCWDWTGCKMDHLGCWAGFGLLLAFLSGATIDSTLPFSRTFEAVEGPAWTNRAWKSE